MLRKEEINFRIWGETLCLQTIDEENLQEHDGLTRADFFFWY